MYRYRSIAHLGVLLIVLFVGLSGCGFYLRGSGVSADVIGPVFITSGARSEIANNLRRTLQDRDVVLSDKREDAAIQLDINSEETNSRTLSIGLNSSLRDIELNYTVNFTARRTDGEATLPEQLRIIREYNYDTNEVLRSADEQDLLYKEMRRELVRRLLVRLSTLSREGEQ